MHADTFIVFPQELLKTMTIEATIFPPDDEQVGVAVLSEHLNDYFIVKLYQLSLSEDAMQYNFIQELTTFKFITHQEIDDFVERLPHISGLEMLLMLNPVPASIVKN